MTRADPGRVLRWSIVGWGLGHLLLGRTSVGALLIASEVVAIGLVAWLTIGLADTSAYLVPYLAGIAFLLVWAWQAVSAYRLARPEPAAAPERSPALAVGWLSIPLLLWGAGFWLVAGASASPASVLDRFITAWSDGELQTDTWPATVIDAAEEAAAGLGTEPDRFRDVRMRVASRNDDRAVAIAEAIHYERRDTRFLGLFAGSQLVPVADRQVLALELVARPVELPGGGEIGAVRWEIVGAQPDP